MCIIATKKNGIDNINWNRLEKCFKHNNDGAGYMFSTPTKNLVEIKKGFMTWNAFKTALKNDIAKNGLVNMDLVLHFRIGTGGGNTKANTHPFIISNKLKDLQLLHAFSNMGVCMNGIIHDIDMPKNANYSDTMQYIKTALYAYKSIKTDFLTKPMIEYIETSTSVKWAFLDSKKGITLIGDFNECDGWNYSNYSYLDYDRYYYSRSYAWYDDNEYYTDTLINKSNEVEVYEGYFVGYDGEYIDITDDILILTQDGRTYKEDYSTGNRTEIFGTIYGYNGEILTYDNVLSGGVI